MTIVLPIFPLTLAAVLYVASVFWNHFELLLRSLAILVVFSLLFAVGMDHIAAESGSLKDDALRRADLLLGVDVVEASRWFREHAIAQKVMELAYFSAIPQTIFLLAYFGFTKNSRLGTFLKRFMAGAAVTLVVFALVPARGNYTDVPDCMQSTADRFDALRAGTITEINPKDAKGIITFPSFHTVWAVLLMAAFINTPVRTPMLLLNLLMIASTIPVGCHYFVDILGGLGICAIVWRIK